jgi:hypothetical protein
LRTVLVAFSLLIVVTSVVIDRVKPTAASAPCRLGLCRFDQVFASIDAEGMNPGNLSALVNEDPGNPMVWCAWADVLAQRGDVGKAGIAFDRAMTLGPNMPAVLMRGINFYMGHGQPRKAIPLSARVLSLTDAFDQIIFSYFGAARIPTPELLAAAVPVGADKGRAARSWLDWERANGSDQDLIDTWRWMKRNRLLDHDSAVNTVWTLWSRKSFRSARDLWLDWIGPSDRIGPNRGDDPDAEELANREFQTEPAGGPFDWTLEAPGSGTLSRKDGLDVRFSGKENLAFSGVRQSAVVRPGHYRFTADMETADITTDQGPFFHIFDPANPAGVHVESRLFTGTMPRSRISLDLSVPASTQALIVQLERRPSGRLYDNKIEGNLHVYDVSLRPGVH